MNNILLEKKLKELLIGKRSFKDRFPIALCSSLALSFILFFFGPLDLSMIAENYVDYTVLDILPTCLKIWGITFSGFFLVSWIPGGKLHVWISSLFAGLAVAFYIQGNWLNIDLGALDGTAIEWQKYGDNALVGLCVFIAILLIPFLIHFFSRKAWKSYVIFTSALLLIMQSVPLGRMLYKAYQDRPAGDFHYIVSKDKEYTVGKENIIVFILDMTSQEELENMLARYPDALESFNDFQYFDNFNTDFHGTFPGANYLLTHYPYDWNIPHEEWFRQSWNSDDANAFYSQMNEAGWNTRVFNHVTHVEGDLENVYGKFSNVEIVKGQATFTINRTVFKKLIKLSFYRYFPLIMKAPFWIYTGELSGMKNLSANEQDWDQIESIQKYLDNGLVVGNEEKVYLTYHYAGAHAPIRIKENGRILTHENGQEIGPEGQLAGHFYAISQYIQQMKDYRVYDTSTIIITSDHGNFFNTQAIFFIKPAGQRQVEMTVSHAPISQSDFMETIAELAGLDKGQFGRSIFDVDENEIRERVTYIRWFDSNYPKIPGKANNAIREFRYTGNRETLYEMIINKDFIGSYQIEDPFY